MKPPSYPPRPPDRKRYGWFRLYNDFLTHPKWDVVAAMSCVEKSRVVSIVIGIEIAGNKGRPRGSVEEFSTLECAASVHCQPDEVRRVYKSLEELGWIDQGHISTWDERQPDKEDATTKERSQRYRKRRKELHKHELAASRRDERDVTTRLDSDIEKKGASVTHLSVGDQVTPEQYNEWLKENRMRQRNLPLGPVVVRGSKKADSR